MIWIDYLFLSLKDKLALRTISSPVKAAAESMTVKVLSVLEYASGAMETIMVPFKGAADYPVKVTARIIETWAFT